jgi:hypothetical protein
MSDRKNKIERSNLEYLDRPIAFHRIFVNVTGSVPSALFLSQVLYWQRRCPAKREGWWWKTAEDWQEETCLTRAQQQKARKTLISLKILEEKRQGIPCRLWFRLDQVELWKKIQVAASWQTGKEVKQVNRDEAGKFAPARAASMPKKRQTISKTTSESTEKETKDYPAEGGENQKVLELEMKYGVAVPQSLVALQDIPRISNILQKEKLEAEVVRLLFAEFDACCCRKVVTDYWALFMTLVRKATAHELHLSAEGEQQMPPWI